MPTSKRLKPGVGEKYFHQWLTGEESGGEHRAFCPICEKPGESTSPSASFNFDKNVWNCLGKCSQGGSIWKLKQDLEKQGILKPQLELSKTQKRSGGRFASAKDKAKDNKPVTDPIDPEKVTAWSRKLFSASLYLAQLIEERGLTEATIKEWKLGWDGNRYTIPVYDKNGTLVNVRRYTMNPGPKGDKVLNITGHGSARLFRPDILKENDEIVVCEGEMDCIILNQYGIPAVTHTGGAMTFSNSWAVEFSGKKVWICYDNDDAGRKGAARTGKMLAAFADNVYGIDIPLPEKGADVTDYFVKEGMTAEDFQDLMRKARPMDPTRHRHAEPEPEKGRPVEIEESMAQDLQDEVIEMQVTVSGKRNPPFVVPRRVDFECGTDKGAICTKCPLFLTDGNMTVEFGKNDPSLVKFIDVPEEKHGRILRDITGVLCSTHSRAEVEETYNMEELVVSNSVDSRSSYGEQNPTSRDVYSVSTHATAVNSTARMVGRNAVNPRTSRKTMIAWNVESVKTSLDTFNLTKAMRDELLSFQQSDEQDPLDKCLEIAKDLSENVTRIYDRDILHVAYDLVWHSPLAFEVEGQLIEKGWLEMMVVGDTRTGKSETAIRLAQHYQSGIVKSCEGATFAGLVGGVQQSVAGHWMTTWGVIPLNDRRLVVLDEVSGLKDKDVIENMSSIRSMGKAQITKINTQETMARTRLIWITNPGDGMMIEERPDVGVGALRSVVKAQEDIARFDYVVAVRASEVDSKVINSTKLHKREEPQFTSEMCQQLVLWSWSLKPEQIKFTDTAVSEARKISSRIGKEYVPDPPLIQTENIRFKLYRIAAAIAARTFAIRWPERGKMELTVTKDHILAAMRFLDMIYDSPGMEYKSASRTVLAARERAKKNRTNTKNYLIQHADTVLVTLRAVSQDTRWKSRDFEEFGGMHKEDAARAMLALQKYGMVQRKPQGYVVMDKMLVQILRELDREDY